MKLLYIRNRTLEQEIEAVSLGAVQPPEYQKWSNSLYNIHIIPCFFFLWYQKKMLFDVISVLCGWWNQARYPLRFWQWYHQHTILQSPSAAGLSLYTILGGVKHTACVLIKVSLALGANCNLRKTGCKYVPGLIIQRKHLLTSWKLCMSMNFKPIKVKEI